MSWVHPCSCTLIAHESCLLNWIQASQQDSSRAKTALKCPQCGATYEIESEKPLVLRFLNGINRSMFLGGAVVTGLSFSIVVASCGLGACSMLSPHIIFTASCHRHISPAYGLGRGRDEGLLRRGDVRATHVLNSAA